MLLRWPGAAAKCLFFKQTLLALEAHSTYICQIPFCAGRTTMMKKTNTGPRRLLPSGCCSSQRSDLGQARPSTVFGLIKVSYLRTAGKSRPQKGPTTKPQQRNITPKHPGFPHSRISRTTLTLMLQTSRHFLHNPGLQGLDSAAEAKAGSSSSLESSRTSPAPAA